MDVAKLLEQVLLSENKMKEIEKELLTIKSILQTNLEDNVEPQMMFDESYRIKVALKTTSDRKEAARLLQICERSLYRKIKKYKLE